jgi:hypothetical protein
MSAEGQQEPSMEDILASIRKILSEDDGEAAKPEPAKAAAPPPPPPPLPPPPPPPPEPEPEVVVASEPEPEPMGSIFEEPDETVEEPEPEPLQLSQSMMVEQEQAPEHPPQPMYEPQPPPPPHFGGPHDYGQGYQQLVSEPVAQASSASIATLAAAVARERAIALGNSGITLEQLVREICTPILKEWLDTNLPYMVERIVKQEIERIVNRTEGIQ